MSANDWAWRLMVNWLVMTIAKCYLILLSQFIDTCPSRS